MPVQKKLATKMIVASFSAVVVFAAGLVWLQLAAAGFFVVAEPEQGSVSSGANIVADVTATGGKAIQFTAPQAPPPAPPPTPPPTTPPPSSPSFPDASNTGPTGNLPLYTGTTDLRTPGTVIQNVEIRTSDIYVGANNITFRNVKVVYTGALDSDFTIFNIPPGISGTVFEDCEIDGQNKVPRAIKGPGDVTVRRCEIHHTGNAVEVGTHFTVEDSYLHDIFTPEGLGLDWHADGIQAAETVSDITVRHNTILLTGDETGAINIIGNAGDTISNVLIDNNLMAGGGYTVYAGAPNGSNFRVTNNHFSTRYHPKVGDFNIWYPQYMSKFTRSGNVIHETGAPANENL